MRSLPLFALILGSALGCSTTVRYASTSAVYADQASDAARGDRFRLIATGLSASAHAAVDSPESTELAARAMNALVDKAHLGPNQALTGVSMEEGTIDRDDGPPIRVVTMRADVVEILPEPAP